MFVNEIFYSLQGEGYFTGTPSVFVRLSGCNLQCPFCDTTHQHGIQMDETEIAAQVASFPARHVVITGGEPSLQLTENLVHLLHNEGKFVAVETNGTHPLPRNVDWITLSPKDAFIKTKAAKIILQKCNEIKCVYNGTSFPDYQDIVVCHRFVQPCDTGDAEQNQKILAASINYCLQHPEWRLSIQTHKFIGVR